MTEPLPARTRVPACDTTEFYEPRK